MPSSFPHDTIRKAIQRGDLNAIREFVARGEFGTAKTSQSTAPETHPLFSPSDGIGADASLLTCACSIGHVEVVRFLLEAGDYRHHYSQYAPEAFAALDYGRLEVFRLLCEHGLDPDASEFSKHGDSITDRVIAQRQTEYLRLLLPLDATIYLEYEETTDEEYENEDYPSTLEIAARAGDVEMVAFLLAADFPLGEHNSDYFLEKARQNIPKLQQWQDEKTKAEDERKRAQLQQREGARKADAKDFRWCMGLLLIVIATCWSLWRLGLWLGWLYGLGAVAVLILIYWGSSQE